MRKKEKWFEMDDSRKLSQKSFESPAISSKFVFLFSFSQTFQFLISFFSFSGIKYICILAKHQNFIVRMCGCSI